METLKDELTKKLEECIYKYSDESLQADECAKLCIHHMIQFARFYNREVKNEVADFKNNKILRHLYKDFIKQKDGVHPLYTIDDLFEMYLSEFFNYKTNGIKEYSYE
jgi:hypothetical protein